jgi:purine nucleosidase
MARKVILDCDPGLDDALAILLAAGDARVELVGVTTVAGNQTLDKTTLNARRVLGLAGMLDVPVVAGCEAPIVRPLLTARHIHGESGLNGPSLKEDLIAPLAPGHGVDFIVETVMSSAPGEVTLVPTGPLTNVAMAVRREPRIVGRVAEVVLMGGSYTRGNRTPAAEFNILVDPEAAAIVFGQAWPLTMVGLDVTNKAVAGQDVLLRLEHLGSAVGDAVREMLDFYSTTYSEVYGFDQGPPVHDPCAVAQVIDDRVLSLQLACVQVETKGEWTTGMTVVDFSGRARQPNAKVATSIDVGLFWDLMIAGLSQLPRGVQVEPVVDSHGR